MPARPLEGVGSCNLHFVYHGWYGMCVFEKKPRIPSMSSFIPTCRNLAERFQLTTYTKEAVLYAKSRCGAEMALRVSKQVALLAAIIRNSE